MKLTVKLSDKITAEVEGATQKELFKQIAALQEVFGEDKCPANGSTDLKYVVRVNDDDNEFFEIKDKKDGYTLAFGQHKKGGTLFPRRRAEDGKVVGVQGWHKWEPEKAKQ